MSCDWAWIDPYCSSGARAVLGDATTLFTAIAVTVWAVPYLGRRIKRVDSALDFTKRFNELMALRHALNQKHRAQIVDDRGPLAPEAQGDADNFYLQFFDLLWSEYSFFRAGLLEADLFGDWMQWRRHSFNDSDAEFMVCGVGYREGWEIWRRHPVLTEHPFVQFLDAIHAARTPEEAIVIVRKHQRSIWKRIFPI